MLISALAISLLATAVSAQVDRKMQADLAPTGRRLTHAHEETSSKTQISRSATFLAECTPGTSLSFDVSAGDGKGMVGLMNNDNAKFSLSFADGDMELSDTPELNVFGAM